MPKACTPLVDLLEIVLVDHNLAAHLKTRRKGPLACEAQGDGAYGPCLFKDHFPLLAVAAGDGVLQDTVHIDELKRQAVELRVAPELHGRFGKRARHALHKSSPFLDTEDVLKAVHAACVPACGKACQKTSAHAQGRRMGGAKFRVLFFESHELGKERVVLLVAYLWRVQGVVEVVVVLKKTHQSVHALADGVCGRASAQGAGVFAGFFPSFFRRALLHPLGELFGLVRTGLGSALAVLFAFDVARNVACDKIQEGGLLRLGAGHGEGSFGVGLKLCGRGFACRGSIEKEAQKIQMSFSHDSGKQWGH